MMHKPLTFPQPCIISETTEEERYVHLTINSGYKTCVRYPDAGRAVGAREHVLVLEKTFLCAYREFAVNRTNTVTKITNREKSHSARWPSGRASDSGARGQGFETYLRRVVSFSKTLYSPKVLVIPRKRWLRPDMTEKLLNGTLSLNTNKSQKGGTQLLKSKVKTAGYLQLGEISLVTKPYPSAHGGATV